MFRRAGTCSVADAPLLESIVVIPVVATACDLAIRSVAQVPFAPRASDVAVSTLIYLAAASPALLVAALGWRGRLHGALLGVPFAVFTANLAFAFGARSRSALAFALIGGLCLGIVSTRLRFRHLVFVGGGASALLAWKVVAAPVRLADTPETSFLLVVLDTTSAERLSTYGHDKDTSPHLTALANRGLLYQRALANAPWTLPSHVSMFTGLLPSELGFDGGFEFAFDGEVGTIAADLEKTKRCAVAISANPMIPELTQMRRGFRHAWGVRQLTRSLPLVALDRIRGREGFQSRGSRVTDLALDWVDRVSPRGKPWFLFLNYLDPHAPYRPPASEKRRFAPEIDPDTVAEDTQEYNSGRLPLTEEVRTAMGALYDAEVAAVDAALGRLLKELGARGYDDSNLLVIVTADHGESLGDHGFVGHLLGMSDSVLHVPPVLAGPGVSRGQVAEAVQLVQLRSTLRTLLGLPPLAGIAPALPPWGEAPEILVAEHPEPHWYARELAEFNDTAPRSLGNWVALERKGLKTLFNDHGEGFSYNLDRDPLEQHPQPLVEGREFVQAYLDRASRAQTKRQVKISAETRWALQQLGYLNKE